MSDVDPDIDVITAVHSPTRPVERAVSSVLAYTSARVRVTVVVHNTDPGPIRKRLEKYIGDSRMRIVEHTDAHRTPAGPKNLGLAMATAPFVAMLDSDDSFEPGALDAWLGAADLSDGLADAVIAPVSKVKGRLYPSPPARWTRAMRAQPRVLDPCRDRLAYRTSPLGLIGRERFGHLRFAEGIPTGEDQPLTAELWFTPGTRVVFPAHAPRYLEHDDQADRVTSTPRSVTAEFQSLELTLDPTNAWASDPLVRLSVGTKLIRVHLFDALRQRLGETWDAESARELAEAAERILAWEPLSSRLLARVDAELLDQIRNKHSPRAKLEELVRARSRIRSFAALFPRDLKYTLHPQAPLRFHIAGALLSRGSNRH